MIKLQIYSFAFLSFLLYNHLKKEVLSMIDLSEQVVSLISATLKAHNLDFDVALDHPIIRFNYKTKNSTGLMLITVFPDEQFFSLAAYIEKAVPTGKLDEIYKNIIRINDALLQGAFYLDIDNELYYQLTHAYDENLFTPDLVLHLIQRALTYIDTYSDDLI